MSAATSGAAPAADPGTIALIQKLIDEKRAALEAASIPSASAPAPPAAVAALAAEPVHAQSSLAAQSYDDGEPDSGELSLTSSEVQMQRSSEAAQLRAMRLQQELLLREAEECTFHPRTNERAGVLKATDPEAFFNRTLQWKSQLENENEDRRRKLEAREMAECTFAPHVTPARRQSAGSARGGGGGSKAAAAEVDMEAAAAAVV